MVCCYWPSRAAQYPMPKWHWTTRLFLMPFSVSHSTCKPPSSLSVYFPARDLCRLPNHQRHFMLLSLRSYIAALGHHSDGAITASISALNGQTYLGRQCIVHHATVSLRVWHIKMNPVITDEVAPRSESHPNLFFKHFYFQALRFDAATPPKLS
jgi:hypothetical protein